MEEEAEVEEEGGMEKDWDGEVSHGEDWKLGCTSSDLRHALAHSLPTVPTPNDSRFGQPVCHDSALRWSIWERQMHVDRSNHQLQSSYSQAHCIDMQSSSGNAVNSTPPFPLAVFVAFSSSTPITLPIAPLLLPFLFIQHTSPSSLLCALIGMEEANPRPLTLPNMHPTCFVGIVSSSQCQSLGVCEVTLRIEMPCGNAVRRWVVNSQNDWATVTANEDAKAEWCGTL
ncbi:unnamed protein product [Hydatigera taeniaeformis]|uniref:SRCR domain-containing protein n=1 Tax=Hydatigena taeniaeformis TaxID=6205 RepID=A0A0R3X8B5_HYDTA|nr:unnamed protein product [Hydatigera taeniaeformis]